MWQRTLIVDPGNEAAELVSAAARAEIEPIFLLTGERPAARVDAPVLVQDRLDGDVITRLAREEGVHGIYAASPKVWAVVAASAARLGLPAMAPGKSEGLIVSHARQLRDHGVHCLSSWMADDLSSVEDAAAALGLPVRVRTAGWADSPRCMLVKHRADLSLALAKVRRHSATDRVIVQRHVEGATIRVLGFKTHAKYLAVEAVREACAEDIFCVPTLNWAPDDGSEQREHLLELARQAGGVLPQGTGFLELEFVRCDRGCLLSGIRAAAGPHPAVRRLVARVSGTDLVEQGLRLGAGLPPQPLHQPRCAAAICWVRSHSGVVDRVKGVERALQCPGVCCVDMTVRVGDTLGHVADLAARDRVGYVMAEGANPRDALDAARRAAHQVEVVTRTTV